MRTLYHVTTRTAVEGIVREGCVMAGFSQGKREWSYWVDENRLEWACVHVSTRRDVPCSALFIVVANHEEELLIRTGRQGVFARKGSVSYTDIRPLTRMLPLEDGEQYPF